MEVEGIVNSRPLTPLSFVDGLDKPSTPKDLLMIFPDSGLPRLIPRVLMLILQTVGVMCSILLMFFETLVYGIPAHIKLSSEMVTARPKYLC